MADPSQVFLLPLAVAIPLAAAFLSPLVPKKSRALSSTRS